MENSASTLVAPTEILRTVTPARRPNTELRTREHLTANEVDALIEAARSNRYGHRDATMILLAFRHGLRAAEVCDLRWDQVDFNGAVLYAGAGTQTLIRTCRRTFRSNQIRPDPFSSNTVAEQAMDESDHALSRRKMISGVGIGMTAAAAGPALTQETDQRHARHDGSEPAMEDPRSKYPKPPFRQQTQPWPGLARDMDPKPDHGETSYRGSGRLTGRKALITGGDSGMGRAAAIAYAREGADVAINYFPSEEPDAREVIQLIRQASRTGIPIPGDLRDEAFCRRLVSEAIQRLGGLDIVVCNAGRQQSRASILDITNEDFDATMKTNIYAPFWIIKAALPHLQPGSCIIGTTSEQAYDPSPDLYDYAQTKAATMNYVKSLAKQLGPKGIRVNGVAPGPIWTPLQISGGAPERKYEQFGSWTVFGRPGQPAELASIYVQLAADDASFTTGNIYGAGGGHGQP